MENFVEQMIEIFEVDSISPSDVLRDLELWDSLSVISLLAVMDEMFGINVEATELADVVTVSDLFSFIEQRRVK